MRNQPPIPYPERGDVYRHVKGRQEYVVIGTADRATSVAHVNVGSPTGHGPHRVHRKFMDKPGWDVVFADLVGDDADMDQLHVRDLFEFTDGRFELVVEEDLSLCSEYGPRV